MKSARDNEESMQCQRRREHLACVEGVADCVQGPGVEEDAVSGNVIVFDEIGGGSGALVDSEASLVLRWRLVCRPARQNDKIAGAR